MAVIVDRYAANVINSDFIDNIRMDIDNCPWPCLENYDDWGDYKFFQNLFFPSLTSYGDRSGSCPRTEINTRCLTDFPWKIR